MKRSDVAKSRKDDINRIRERANSYIVSIPKEALSAILLSGSVARGDFFPGRLGGMIDLAVFSKASSSVTAEELFGKNEDPEIPYHCVNRGGDWYQIWFNEMLNVESYRLLPEARKFALAESIVLWQVDEAYSTANREFKRIAAEETTAGFKARLGGVGYLMSEYKVDRWRRRNEPGQLHFNLNSAIELAIGCLYNLNGKYVPASDRAVYYSYELENRPLRYEHLLKRLMNIKLGSIRNYSNREKVFRSQFLRFLDEQRLPNKSLEQSP
jgi:hypothetical protein